MLVRPSKANCWVEGDEIMEGSVMVTVAVGVAVEDSKEASFASWYFRPDFKMKNNQILHTMSVTI